MMSKIKNIIIFLIIAAALVLVYVYFFKKSPEESNLVSNTNTSAIPTTTSSGDGSAIGADFLSLLLSVKSIKLDDAIFSTPSFSSLHDSSIELIPDGTEGRPNPFAPIGKDIYPTVSTTTTESTLVPTEEASTEAPTTPTTSTGTTGNVAEPTTPVTTPTASGSNN